MKKQLDQKTLNKILTLYKNINYLQKNHALTTKQMAAIIEISEKKLMLLKKTKSVGYFYDFHVENICNYFHISADSLFLCDLEKNDQTQ